MATYAEITETKTIDLDADGGTTTLTYYAGNKNSTTGSVVGNVDKKDITYNFDTTTSWISSVTFTTKDTTAKNIIVVYSANDLTSSRQVNMKLKDQTSLYYLILKLEGLSENIAATLYMGLIGSLDSDEYTTVQLTSSYFYILKIITDSFNSSIYNMAFTEGDYTYNYIIVKNGTLYKSVGATPFNTTKLSEMEESYPFSEYTSINVDRNYKYYDELLSLDTTYWHISDVTDELLSNALNTGLWNNYIYNDTLYSFGSNSSTTKKIQLFLCLFYNK